MNTTLTANTQDIKSIHNYKVISIDGDTIDMSQYKGKKLLIVNTASKCGFTKQYAKLEELYKKYGGEKFEIIGFPSNDFLRQEPGTDEEIKAFCQLNYGVSFQMMSKISVKGKNIHPIYEWLTKKSNNGVSKSKVKWNFQKYIIDENGKLVKMFAPNVDPMSPEIISLINS